MYDNNKTKTSKNFIVIAILTLVILSFFAVFHLFPILMTRGGRDALEMAIVRTLRNIKDSCYTYKSQDYAKNGGLFPVGNDKNIINNGKYCGLYFDVDKKGTRITLIEYTDAVADCRADGDTEGDAGDDCKYIVNTIPNKTVNFKSTSKMGYWFGLMMFYNDGMRIIPYDKKYSKDHFAIVAFPDLYNENSRYSFVMKEDGKIYKKDLGKGKYIDTFPGPNPTKHGWRPVERKDEGDIP